MQTKLSLPLLIYLSLSLSLLISFSLSALLPFSYFPLSASWGFLFVSLLRLQWNTTKNNKTNLRSSSRTGDKVANHTHTQFPLFYENNQYSRTQGKANKKLKIQQKEKPGLEIEIKTKKKVNWELC